MLKIPLLWPTCRSIVITGQRLSSTTQLHCSGHILKLVAVIDIVSTGHYWHCFTWLLLHCFNRLLLALLSQAIIGVVSTSYYWHCFNRVLLTLLKKLKKLLLTLFQQAIVDIVSTGCCWHRFRLHFALSSYFFNQLINLLKMDAKRFHR